MSNLYQTCRFILFSLLLMSFLQGVIQGALLEVLHTIGHVNEWVTGDYAHHSFHSHQSDHLHSGLNKYKEFQDKQDSDPLVLKSENKIRMICFTADQLIPDSKQTTGNFQYYFSLKQPFLPIITPPPAEV